MRRVLSNVALVALVNVGCGEYPEVTDHGRVCATATHRDDGDYDVVVSADSLDCASDHRGASYSCSIEVDGSVLVVETRFQDGKDPNDGCAGPLVATCEAVVPAGTLTLEFGGEQLAFDLDGADELCLPSDAGETV